MIQKLLSTRVFVENKTRPNWLANKLLLDRKILTFVIDEKHAPNRFLVSTRMIAYYW